jgi:hypothetical protein
MVVSRIAAIAAVVVLFLPAVSQGVGRAQSPGKVRAFPCRIVVERPLLQVVDDAWQKSESFRQLCRALAERRAVATLRPGPERSGSRGLTQITIADDGVVVGRVAVLLGFDTLEYIAHELEHVLERAEGMDLAGESARKGSGVWKALDGYETQRAIDRGRQVAREVRESVQPVRAAKQKNDR